MKKYTYAAYDWNGNLVEITVIAESRGAAGKMARCILEGSREYINSDEGIVLNNEEEYK